MWHVPFFTEVLPRNAQRLEDTPHMRCRTLREAINGANGPLYNCLPLLAAAFTNFDVAEELGERGALVVAEQVVRVRDPNREHNRVDFFCYKENGDVVRYHPGRTRKDDAIPHRMPFGSLLFHMADARLVGVGATLHAQPPRMVELADQNHPRRQARNELLATREDMEALCAFDIKCVNWKGVREELHRLEDWDQPVDCSDGQHFPWWVWLANTGAVQNVVNDGVMRVELVVVDGNKSVVVHSVRGEYWLSPGGWGELVIDQEPRRYDR